jgi:phospholipid N-methyltransferase
MVKGIGLDSADAVLEYGPGTGAFTQFILPELKPGARFAAIELNPQLVRLFKARFPQVQIFQDTVANAWSICEQAGVPLADCIISGLPWATFPAELQKKCLDEMMRVLKPEGLFVTFSYVHALPLPPARRFASLLPNYFTGIEKSQVVWLNLPPAFVYRCRR